MSCSQWLLQKTLVKKKPVVLKSVPSQDPAADADRCEICNSATGMLQQCTFSKVRAGEDKMLETLYRDYAQDELIDVSRDHVAGEFFDQLIEGGLCDSIQHPSANGKYTKGCAIDFCGKKMHVECARRAEYHMRYDPEVDNLDFFCSHHTPLPLKVQLKDSLEEQIKNVTDFADSYQTILKESPMLLEWTDKEQSELFTAVADSFFELAKLNFCVERGPDGLISICEAEDEIGLLPDNRDWRVTLSYDAFPWQSITVGDHDSIDCWKKFWELVGLSE